MGCCLIEKPNIPVLYCYFELNNKDQKNYCFEFKDAISYEKPIRYEIKGGKFPFSIKIKINGELYDIQNDYENAKIKDDLDKLNHYLNKFYTDDINDNDSAKYEKSIDKINNYLNC